MTAVIELREALQKMHLCDRRGPVPFSITYDQYDSQKKSVGDRIHIPQAQLVWRGKKGNNITHEQFLETAQVQRNPNHYKNATRNVKPINTTELRKLGIWYIYEFNGMDVKYAING